MSESAPNPGNPVPPDALLDALFDGELSAQARRDVLGAVRHDPHARRELERTAQVLSALRTPLDSPDLTGAILARADHRRRFVPGRLRRLTKLGRAGVIVLALVVMLGVAAGRRAWPERLALAHEQTPLTDINAAVQQDAAQGVGAIRAGILQVRMSFDGIADAPACSSHLQIEARTRTLTAGLVTERLGPIDCELDSPPSIRCGATRLGSGPSLIVADPADARTPRVAVRVLGVDP
ncbi:MAG: hypothetical protein R3B57_02610 [Phycisphaerales bacterium]